MMERIEMKTKAIAIMLGIFLCGTVQAEWVEFVPTQENPP